MRKSYTNLERICLVATAKAHIAQGLSLRKAAKKIGITHGQLSEWRKNLEKYKAARAGACSTCGGPRPEFAEYEDDVIAWMMEKYDEGKAVTVRSIIREFCLFDGDFESKDCSAKYKAVW
jgi:transposase-like protein